MGAMRRWAWAVVVAAAACGGGEGGGEAAIRQDPEGRVDTLVLHDAGGPWAFLGELYAVSAGHLASHFGTWRAKPVTAYRAGEMARARAVVYVGSTYDEPLPEAFLDDVLAGTTPVVWLGLNVWQLARRDAAFADRYGFTPGVLDTSAIPEVRYKGQALTRYAPNAAGILALALDPAKAAVLATAARRDGTTLPWAVRSRNLTYLTENPFTYTGESDRYLVFADLLFDVLAPATPERHRALVRIEDVTPKEDPAKLRAIADALEAEGVPFSVALVPVYVDARGAYSSDGRPERLRLRDAPEVVSALEYMISRGGELVLHGYTHQHEELVNPYNGVSADDFEFWTAHVDAENRVVYDGPVPGDSAELAAGRVRAGLEEIAAAGLPAPDIFEYPHYAGSAVDSRAIAAIIPTAYHRGLYFSGALSGGPDDPSRFIGQLFPYVVTDVYGFRVIPENIGNYQPLAYNAGVETRFPEDLVRNARANRVVRDGFASFFFHPFFEVDVLVEIVRGVKREGYTFVSASSL
jgi:uncharacterized protein YdaL